MKMWLLIIALALCAPVEARTKGRRALVVTTMGDTRAVADGVPAAAVAAPVNNWSTTEHLKKRNERNAVDDPFDTPLFRNVMQML